MNEQTFTYVGNKFMPGKFQTDHYLSDQKLSYPIEMLPTCEFNPC